MGGQASPQRNWVNKRRPYPSNLGLRLAKAPCLAGGTWVTLFRGSSRREASPQVLHRIGSPGPPALRRVDDALRIIGAA
jgi:hypothetical protein